MLDKKLKEILDAQRIFIKSVERNNFNFIKVRYAKKQMDRLIEFNKTLNEVNNTVEGARIKSIFMQCVIDFCITIEDESNENIFKEVIEEWEHVGLQDMIVNLTVKPSSPPQLVTEPKPELVVMPELVVEPVCPASSQSYRILSARELSILGLAKVAPDALYDLVSIVGVGTKGATGLLQRHLLSRYWFTAQIGEGLDDHLTAHINALRSLVDMTENHAVLTLGRNIKSSSTAFYRSEHKMEDISNYATGQLRALQQDPIRNGTNMALTAIEFWFLFGLGGHHGAARAHQSLTRTSQSLTHTKVVHHSTVHATGLTATATETVIATGKNFTTKQLITHYQSQDLDFAFRCATSKGDITNMQLLIDDGADVNSQGKLYKKTALHIACERQHVPTIRFLLDIASCSPFIEDKSGKLALDYLNPETIASLSTQHTSKHVLTKRM